MVTTAGGRRREQRRRHSQKLEGVIWPSGGAGVPPPRLPLLWKILVSNPLIPPLSRCRTAQLLKQNPTYLTDGQRIGLG